MDTESDNIGPDEVSEVLGVPVEQVDVLVEQGLLTPVDGADRSQFSRAEVEAVRLQGG
jgi:hypothetical protein